MAIERAASKQGQPRSGGRDQTPPEVKIWIGQGTPVDIRAASMGQRAMGRYAANYEYYHQGDLTSLPASLTLSSMRFATDESEASLNEFFGTTRAVIDYPRTRPSWQAGVRTTPLYRTAVLYRLPNPDGAEGYNLGLMLEINASSALEAVVLYKAYDATEAAWKNTVFERTLARLDTIDPRSLDTRITDWSYTVMENVR